MRIRKKFVLARHGMQFDRVKFADNSQSLSAGNKKLYRVMSLKILDACTERNGKLQKEGILKKMKKRIVCVLVRFLGGRRLHNFYAFPISLLPFFVFLPNGNSFLKVNRRRSFLFGITVGSAHCGHGITFDDQCSRPRPIELSLHRFRIIFPFPLNSFAFRRRC